jgi:uncharacterized protein (UPF0210 family)
VKIRTITLGINWREDDSEVLERDIKNFFTSAKGLFTGQGFESRTVRIALPALVISGSKDSRAARLSIERVSALCRGAGIRWFCVPFYAVQQDMAEINAIAVDVTREYKNAFINYIVTEDGQLDRKAVFHASKFVRAVSQLSDNGFDNFRCGVSFNCKPNGAFFPFTHHAGKNGFSISLELVPLCVKAIRRKRREGLENISSAIIDELLPMLKQVDQISLKVEQATGMVYYGIDTSLAPHPEHAEHSVAYLVELLGIERFGSSGTAFITSFLTDIIKSLIKRSGIRTTGFNGVMYSVLEDPRLGVVNSEAGSLSVDSLLAFSTMCGCGIDMVPVPGDISAEEIGSIMLDVAAVAIRLKKPLGVRLLPIPGKVAGELTDFNHDFLHNTKIQEVKYRAFPGNFFDAEQLFGYL